jgi:hypothetical protein
MQVCSSSSINTRPIVFSNDADLRSILVLEPKFCSPFCFRVIVPLSSAKFYFPSASQADITTIPEDLSPQSLEKFFFDHFLDNSVSSIDFQCCSFCDRIGIFVDVTAFFLLFYFGFITSGTNSSSIFEKTKAMLANKFLRTQVREQNSHQVLQSYLIFFVKVKPPLDAKSFPHWMQSFKITEQLVRLKLYWDWNYKSTPRRFRFGLFLC